MLFILVGVFVKIKRVIIINYKILYKERAVINERKGPCYKK